MLSFLSKLRKAHYGEHVCEILSNLAKISIDLEGYFIINVHDVSGLKAHNEHRMHGKHSSLFISGNA